VAGIAGPFLPCESSGNTNQIVIRNGTIHDGTTATPFAADVGICDDRIVAVGNLAGFAGKIIDARGCIVTPGFIDVHDHSDSIFLRYQQQSAPNDPKWAGNRFATRQGVTTVIDGNCGYGFTDMNEYYSFLDPLPFGSNTYYLAPHGNDVDLTAFGQAVWTRRRGDAAMGRARKHCQRSKILSGMDLIGLVTVGPTLSLRVTASPPLGVHGLSRQHCPSTLAPSCCYWATDQNTITVRAPGKAVAVLDR
jgi:hypothetical protein